MFTIELQMENKCFCIVLRVWDFKLFLSSKIIIDQAQAFYNIQIMTY